MLLGHVFAYNYNNHLSAFYAHFHTPFTTSLKTQRPYSRAVQKKSSKNSPSRCHKIPYCIHKYTAKGNKYILLDQETVCYVLESVVLLAKSVISFYNKID